MLDNFRKIDLVWNNAYEKLGNVRTAQFDEKGRKLVVQVTDDGDIVDLTGAELKLVTIDGLEYENRNLLYGEYIESWGSDGVQSIGSYRYRLGPYSSGIRVRPEIIERNVNYVLSFRIQKTSGFIENINGHSSGLNIPKVYIDGALVGESWLSQIEYPDDEETHHIAIHFNYIGEGQTGIYIQPNRTRYAHEYSAEIWDLQLEKGNKPTDWTPAPEDLQFPFDLVDPSRGIYELYFPKLFVDRYTGKTKVFLELTTKDFSVTSEPFYINVFEGVR